MRNRTAIIAGIASLGLAAVVVAVAIGPLRTTTTPASAASPGAAVLANVFLVDAASLAAERTLYRSGDPSMSAKVLPLLQRANRDLSVTPPAVTAKPQLPPSGDRHDYLSQSVYAWPDPTKPKGLPYVIRDGDRNPAVDAIPDKANLIDMINWSHELAYAYYFSGDQAYAAKAATILQTWFLNPATKMTPNLTYAQGLPGRYDGQAGGIIDAADLPEVVDAVQLLAGATAWRASDTTRMQSWFSSYLRWLTTASSGKTEGATSNNHATWYADQVISYALFTGNTALAKATVVRGETTILRAQITSSGSQPRELTRTDSWSYSTYNLDALARFAQLAANVHIDLWHYTTATGASIHGALNFVLAHQSHWTYPQGRAITAQYLVEPLYAAAAAYDDSTYAAAATKAAASLQAAYPSLAVLYPNS